MKKENTILISSFVAFLSISIALSCIFAKYVFAYEKEKIFFEYDDSTECYVTITGHCFHNESCRYLLSSIKTTVGEAKKDGYRQCSNCTPTIKRTVKVNGWAAGIFECILIFNIPVLYFLPTKENIK